MVRNSYRVKFPGGSGFDLAGIVDRPDDRDAAPVAIFSHCFTCNKDLKAIVRIARGLAERGIAVLRFDMTGLGGSEGDFSHTNFTTNLADLRAAIRFANAELGAVTALIGHSFGGAASLATAAQAGSESGPPEELQRLAALVTLAAPSDTAHLALLLSRMDPAIERDGVGRVSIGGREWTIRREMLEDFRQHSLPSQISAIGIPTLIIHSPVDATVGYDNALRIQGLIQTGPTQAEDADRAASLLTLRGSDHLLSDDPRDLELVIASVAAFLNRYGLLI